MTNPERQNAESTRCPGSGYAPVERVILDTIPGVDPRGTCQGCGKSLTLKWWRLPDHDGLVS